MSNPFTEIKAALRTRLGSHWDALAADNPARVRVGNRWGRNALKPPSRQPADLPAVDVRRVETRDMKLTSSSGVFLAVFEFGITSDERASTDDTEVMDASEWELIRCAIGAAVSTPPLGLSYVQRIGVESSQQTLADPAQSGGTQRWTSAVRIVVEFNKPRSEIIPS
jgi:hypothetical protein